MRLRFTLWVSLASVVTATTTVIDLISTDPGFSLLVKALQKYRLIPLLNAQKTCTFFAPTNAAFQRLEAQGIPVDRELLMYHILSEKYLAHDLKDGLLLETVLVKPGYLGDHNEGQLVGVSRPTRRPGRKEHILVGEAEIIEPDWVADNGIVHVLDHLLVPPVDVVETLAKHADIKQLADLVAGSSLNTLLRQHRPFTLFAPTTSAMSRLSSIQTTYLQHQEGLKDLEMIIEHHAHGGALYANDFPHGTTGISTIQGQDLMVNVDEKIMVDNADVESKDILASNGVIHTVTKPLMPSAMIWTAAKYLVGLNATKFATLLRDSGLGYAIDDPKARYTIFAPQDDSFTTDFKDRDQLQYHIVKGRLLRADLKNGQLLKTDLFTDELDQAFQPIKVSIRMEHKIEQIYTNDVEVVGEPVQVGNSVIYMVSKPLTPPFSLLKTIKASPDLAEFSNTLALTGIGRRLNDARGITVFAPNTGAWNKLGVVANYLRLPEALHQLEKVARYSIVEHVIYSNDFNSGRSKLLTSEGSSIVVEKSGEAIHVGEGRLNRASQVGGKIEDKDILIASGVIHAVGAVALPPTLSITLYNVLQGAGTKGFLTAFENANISRILRDWDQDYTIFAPSDKAFEDANLESALQDRDFVDMLVRLHVIPNKILKPEEDAYDEEASMLSKDALLAFRDIHGDGSKFGVRVKGARSSKEALIIATGMAHPASLDGNEGTKHKVKREAVFYQDVFNFGDDDGGGSEPLHSGVVYVIDRVLLPGDVSRLHQAWFWIGVILVGSLISFVLCMMTAVFTHSLIQHLREVEGYQRVPTDEEAPESGANGSATVPPAANANTGVASEPNESTLSAHPVTAASSDPDIRSTPSPSV